MLKILWSKLKKSFNCLCICIFKSKCVNCKIIIENNNYKSINGKYICLDCHIKTNI